MRSSSYEDDDGEEIDFSESPQGLTDNDVPDPLHRPNHPG